MMNWAMLGEKKREGAPTGSEGLGIKPSKGEVSTPVTNKFAISTVVLGGEQFQRCPRAIPMGTVATLMGYVGFARKP